MRGDQNGCANAFVQLCKQAQDLAGHFRIHIAGWFIGDQQVRLVDQGSGNRHALLLPAGQRRDGRVDPFAQSDPAQQIDHFIAIGILFLPRHAQRQSDIFESREMVQQAEFLKHHADTPPDRGQLLALQLKRLTSEQSDIPASWRMREV